MTTVEYRSRFNVSAAALFGFHERTDALEILMPPWEQARVVSREGGIAAGARVVIETKVGPLWLPWVAVHERYVPGVEFVDRAERGPFRAWRHTHRVTPAGDMSAWLSDDIEYELPLGAAGALVAGGYVRRRLGRMFAHRHAATARALGAVITEGYGIGSDRG